MNLKSAIKKSGLNLSISIFDKIISFVSIPIFTHLMTTDAYGSYSTYLAWVGVLEHVIGLSMEYSVRTAYYDFREDYEEYCSSIFSLATLIAGGVISICAAIFGGFGLAVGNVVLLCIIHSFILFCDSCLDFKATIEANYRAKAIVRILPSMVGFILSLLLVLHWQDNTFLARTYGTISGFFIVVLLLILNVVRKGRTFYNKKYWAYGITTSLPLILHGLSTVALANSDRIMISIIRSNSEAGIYSTAYSLGQIGLALTTALESMWIPWFSKKLYQGKYNSVNEGVKLYLLLGASCSIGVICIGPDLLNFMTTSDYSSGSTVLIPVAMGTFLTFLYSISVHLEIFYKKTASIARNTVIAAVLNIVLNLGMIKLYGMMGAAIATILSYLVLFILHYRNARKIDNRLFPIKLYFFPLVEVVEVALVAMIALDYIFIRWTLVILILGFNVAMLWRLYKKNNGG